MASKPVPREQSIFQYKTFHIDKSQLLGRGSYGAVYKAKCDQLPCAAKVLHQTILNSKDVGADKIMQRFKQECAFLERIRHPHIVQYLGVTMDPDSRLPVLLMELLNESLTKMLEHSQHSLAYYVQVDICHDIALAVAYLHSNDIIHRDLSSNNVLIIAGRRAKVTDFGMSKLAGAAPSMTPLTMCPGTLAYMPPEALREPPRYTKKLDCFSEGVIMIQVCTRLWPEPGPRTQLVRDARSPTGMIEMPVLEQDRRRNHIDLIDPSHPLLPIVMDCLQYQEEERLSSDEICVSVGHLMKMTAYKESMSRQQTDGVDSNSVRDISKMKAKIKALEVKQTECNLLIRQQSEEIEKKNRELEQKDRYLQQKESLFQKEITSREKRMQKMNRDLQDQGMVSRELQEANDSLQKEVEDLQELLSGKDRRSTEDLEGMYEQVSPPVLRSRSKEAAYEPFPSQVLHPSEIMKRQIQDEHVYCALLPRQSPKQQPHPQSHPVPIPIPPRREKIQTLEWRDGGKAPYIMERGDTVVYGNMAYFVNILGEACSYNAETKKWNELSKCPFGYSSLAIIYGHLTAIGGCTLDKFDPQNKLVSRIGNRGWTEHFPPMPTKRWKSAAISTDRHLVVAGGKKDTSSHLDTVEVLDIENGEWCAVFSLPHPFSEATATLCGENVYMLGGFDNNGKTKSVITCSLANLLQRKRKSQVWQRLADVPATRSTCTTVNGQLLAVGGLDSGNRKTSAIYAYSSSTNSWNLISNMPTAQYNRLVAVLPSQREMIVVGGCTRFKTDKVDIAKTK